MLLQDTFELLAVHHCGGACPGLGTPSALLWPRVRLFLQKACTRSEHCQFLTDGNGCLVPSCQRGICEYLPTCEDEDPCTHDICISGKRCFHFPLPDCPAVAPTTRIDPSATSILKHDHTMQNSSQVLQVTEMPLRRRAEVNSQDKTMLSNQSSLRASRFSLPSRCGDGHCDGFGRESCLSCPQDCVGDPAPTRLTQEVSRNSPRCGDGTCQLPFETCLTCPTDCFGLMNSSHTICCGYGLGFISCSDLRCNSNSMNCEISNVGEGRESSEDQSNLFCCGDNICSSPWETCQNCPADCSEPEKCWDGVDNNCNGQIDSCGGDPECPLPAWEEFNCFDQIDEDCDGLLDCEDPDCALIWPCQCRTENMSCQLHGQCCDKKCVGYRCQ